MTENGSPLVGGVDPVVVEPNDHQFRVEMAALDVRVTLLPFVHLGGNESILHVSCQPFNLRGHPDMTSMHIRGEGGGRQRPQICRQTVDMLSM